MAEDAFARLLAEVTAGGRRFDHRRHVHVTWLAVRRCGMPGAIEVVCDGIPFPVSRPAADPSPPTSGSR